MCSTPELSGRNRGRSRTVPERAVTSPQGRRRQLRQPAARCRRPVRAERRPPITTAVSIDEAQYPVVAEFAVRLAQDHAEQEFADGLRDLLDRLATHPGVPVQVS